MGEVSETDLPGVGIRYDMSTSGGRGLGVVVHQSGRRDLVVYDKRDPDSASESVELSEDEAHTLAEVLGGSRVVEHIDETLQRIEDLVISWVRIEPDASVVGQTLAEASLPNRTGASVVALVTETGSTPAPGGSDRLIAGDTAVVIGSAESVAAVTVLLAPGH